MKHSLALETKDGIFLLESSDLLNYSFEEKEEITIHVKRFDLLDWLPIE